MNRTFVANLAIAVCAAAVSAISVVASPDAQTTQRPPSKPVAPAKTAAKGIACDEFLVPQRTVKGKVNPREFKVGPTSCLMIEGSVTVAGRQFVRLDLGLDGTVDGYVSTNPKGDYRGYLTNAPDLVFPQTADAGPIVLAIARYRKDHGAAMSVIYPSDRSAWNGKMWVTVHGASGTTEIPWDGFDPRLSSYDEQMLSRGYVLVKTRRTANADGFTRSPNQQPTGIATVLENDRTFNYAGFNDTHRYATDFTIVAENLIKKRLGQTPTRTYFYGHSAGARIGRGLNYVAGLNQGPDGKPLFDGIFVDDSGAGTWLPIIMKNGKDVLFTTEAEKAAMVPQLEIVHQMYNRIWPTNIALGVTNSYLENKRINARMMRDKGLTPKFRAYEVRSISHSAGGPNLDVSPFFGDMFDMLDAWVDKGVVPPPMRSDWEELGDVDDDGVIENPGLSLPEVACPLGVYYPTNEHVRQHLLRAVHRHGSRAARQQQSVRRHEPQRRLGPPGKPDPRLETSRPPAVEGGAHAREVRRLHHGSRREAQGERIDHRSNRRRLRVPRADGRSGAEGSAREYAQDSGPIAARLPLIHHACLAAQRPHRGGCRVRPARRRRGARLCHLVEAAADRRRGAGGQRCRRRTRRLRSRGRAVPLAADRAEHPASRLRARRL